ncbi:MAG: serine/threonine protein kinase [Myxococcaceae bacterium]|nr:serine/threonine protein kinase [Myxococcaceae bacterium]
MNFLCPSCRTPLPREQTVGLVTCTQCAVQVDLTRVDTAPGQARLWPEVDLKGETLSGHLLVQRLGSGGMGTVYEAESPVGAQVAMKVLSPMLAAEPALRERFRREARALTKVKHPRVVQLFEEGEDRGFCWYSMELVKGLDLRNRLEKGVMPAAEVEALALATLEGLQAVHDAGVVHRDVKPANILLGPEGPRLCDFGIAQVSGATTLTESAALLGSLRYMAPEQRWGKADDRSDLYALGVVLHEALSGGVPGEQPLPGGVPAHLAQFVDRLTRQSPAQRPSSAAEATKLLAELRTGVKKRLVIGGGVAAAVLVVGVVALLVGGGGGTQATETRPGPTPTRPAGDAPPPLVIDAGAPDAGAELDGGATLDAGTLDLDIEVAALTGSLALASPDAIGVELDGKQRALPKEPLLLPVGKHQVRFVCPGGKAQRFSKVLEANLAANTPVSLAWTCRTMKPELAPAKVTGVVGVKGGKKEVDPAVPPKAPVGKKPKPLSKKKVP